MATKGNIILTQRVDWAKDLCQDAAHRGARVGLVPTMGALHQGHIVLMEQARQACDFLVVSIFVNPTQFCPGEDLDRYPKDLDGDVKKAAQAGADLAFAPSAKEMYPEGHQTHVEVAGVTKGLCGASRPGHFNGVTTVVLKLLNIVRPQVAVFGEKDYQQLVAIRTMVRDLNLAVEVRGVATVREADGLAMSSRNVYLSAEDRLRALALPQALAQAQQLYASGVEGASELVQGARGLLEGLEVEYLEVRHPLTLVPLVTAEEGARVLGAVRVGGVRLIDNVGLWRPPQGGEEISHES